MSSVFEVIDTFKLNGKEELTAQLTYLIFKHHGSIA